MASPVAQSGRFQLDLVRYQLLDGSRSVHLERQPMELLILLVKRRGELVSREEIAAQLWSNGVFVDADQSINRAMRKLRLALHEDPDHPKFVETVVGKGYRFTGDIRITGLASERFQSSTSKPDDSSIVPAFGEPHRSSRRIIFSAVLLILSAASIAATWFLSRHRTASPAPRFQSIAVLPLENLSGDPDQEYFAEGMTEALTTELAQISALKVISHTSVVQYKGTKKSLPQIAKELSVDAVVEGAVERAGDKVEITVQLIQAPSDHHLWAKSYERDLRDVLDLQREVTHSITDEIQAKLTPPEKAHLASARPIDPEAYEDYLKGRFLLEKGDVRKSIAYFQEAIQKHPNYALAYAGLANSYISLGLPWGGDLSPKDVLPQAKAAARKALEIDDSVGQAHLALARVIQLYDWDWPAVEKEYRRAVDLNPNDDMAHAWYGEYLQEMGRNEEAFVQMRQAMTLDPLNPGGANELGYAFYTARQYDQAIRAFQKALQLEPDYVDAHEGLGWVYEEKKMYREAIAELEKAVNLSNRHELCVASLGKVLGNSRRQGDT